MSITYPFTHGHEHTCKAAVLTCVDFRFWEFAVRFVKEEAGINSFDFPSMPGAGKVIIEHWDLDLIKDIVKVSVNLHHIEKFFIFDHMDCGAYGGSGKFANKEEEKKFHEDRLCKTRGIIQEMFPDLKIVLAYIMINEDYNEATVIEETDFTIAV
jgi:hypothetical protein